MAWGLASPGPIHSCLRDSLGGAISLDRLVVAWFRQGYLAWFCWPSRGRVDWVGMSWPACLGLGLPQALYF